MSRFAFALLCLLTVAGCGDAVGPSDALSAARARWEQWGAASYDLTITRSCECLSAMSGPVRVAVRNGVVTSRVNGRGDPTDPRFDDLFPPVEGLFDLVNRGIHEGWHSVEVQYDPITGYPVKIKLNYDEVWGNDDEIIVSATLVVR